VNFAQKHWSLKDSKTVRRKMRQVLSGELPHAEEAPKSLVGWHVPKETTITVHWKVSLEPVIFHGARSRMGTV
jgi:hypothetical protein